jgi:hypothetical protein
MDSILGLLITVIIAGVIFYLLYWLIGVVGLPEPFSKVAIVLLALVAVVFLIGLLTGGIPAFHWRR